MKEMSSMSVCVLEDVDKQSAQEKQLYKDVKKIWIAIDNWKNGNLDTPGRKNYAATILLQYQDLIRKLAPMPKKPKWLFRGMAFLKKIPEPGQPVLYTSKKSIVSGWTSSLYQAKSFCGSYFHGGLILAVNTNDIDDEQILFYPYNKNCDFAKIAWPDPFPKEQEWIIDTRKPLKVSAISFCDKDALEYKHGPEAITRAKDLKGKLKEDEEEKMKKFDKDIDSRRQETDQKLTEKNETEEKLVSKLFDASKKGNLKMIKHLVRRGVDVNAHNDYAICFASENGQLDVVKFLESQGADVVAQNNYPLILASENGHFDVVRFLVSRGADVNAQSDSAVIGASKNGHLDVVKFLVSRDADITADDNFAVRAADARGHHDVVKYLISRGAKLSIQEKTNQKENNKPTFKRVSTDNSKQPLVLVDDDPVDFVEEMSSMSVGSIEGAVGNKKLSQIDKKQLTERVMNKLLTIIATEDKLKGGLGDKKQPSDFDVDQIKKGIAVEMEHTDDPEVAKEIALDHLTEDPEYYDKLEKMEKEF
jgi:hypothetical protein